VTSPIITRALDRAGVGVAGVGVVAFRLLVHIARCADGRTDATVTLAGVAAACGMDASRTRHNLRALSAVGLRRVRWDGEAAHVTLMGAMLTEGGQCALIVPAWLDDAGLTPVAVRLMYHYLRRAREGRVTTRRDKASKLCGMSQRAVGIAERELIGRGWLEPRGQRCFGLTLAAVAAATLGQDGGVGRSRSGCAEVVAQNEFLG
jgi:hypothetical protein